MTEPVYWQSRCIIDSQSRGFHLITPIIVDHLQKAPKVGIGLLNLFIQHTSASLAISENTCPEVPLDLETHFNRLVPDDNRLFQHTLEGEDDMPAHIKNVILGCSLNIPISKGKLNLGQWQGIYLCEHRNHAPKRTIILTLHGIIET